MYFEKLLEMRRLYFENAFLENLDRKKFATLKLLLGQDVEQLPKSKTKNQRFLYIETINPYCLDSHSNRTYLKSCR